MVILGGSGNQAGVVLGALIISPLLEVLRDADKSRVLFFVALVGGARVPRPSQPADRDRRGRDARLRLRAARDRARDRRGRGSRASPVPAGSRSFVEHWVIAPEHPARWIAPVAYVGVIARGARSAPCSRGIVRDIVLVPTLYLGAFVWENVMLSKPEPARYIVLGADPDRADGPATERPARRTTRGDRLMALLELDGRLAVVRRPEGRRRARPARRRGRDRLGDRPERRRQDDALQPDHGHLPAAHRRHPLRRAEHRRPRAAPDLLPRDLADVPDAAPVPEHVGEGERDGRLLRPHEGRDRSLDAAHAGDAARGARDRGARAQAARRSSASG